MHASAKSRPRRARRRFCDVTCVVALCHSMNLRQYLFKIRVGRFVVRLFVQSARNEKWAFFYYQIPHNKNLRGWGGICQKDFGMIDSRAPDRLLGL